MAKMTLDTASKIFAYLHKNNSPLAKEFWDAFEEDTTYQDGYIQALKDNFSSVELITLAKLFLSNFSKIDTDKFLASHNIFEDNT